MSETLPVQIPDSDISPQDMEKIHKYKGDGLPGLARLGESDFHRMTEMYMNGFTYWQIASSMNVARPLVMYLSHTYGWYSAKQEYMRELNEKMKGRVVDSKIVSQDFIILLIKAYEKKIGKKLKQYLATDDAAHADQINLKEVDKLLKAVEILQSLNSQGKVSNKAAGVELGLDGFSGTIERSEDNKLKITPAIDAHLDGLLKKMADDRRAEQHKASKTSDIKEDKPNNEEPNNEN